MNPQNPTPAEALRKAAHFLRSLRAQSTSEENWQAFEPFAAETLETVEAALARPPLPSESVALIHREALLGAALDMRANWEGNLSDSMARLNDAIALALDENEAPDGAPFLEYLANNFPDLSADRAGDELARGLSLRVSHDHPDRWVTEWGTKTSRGLARIVLYVIAQSISAEASPEKGEA
jgi:hypothetical protein